MGYEAIRAQTLARQKEMGLVPPDTELPPINPIGTPETRTGPEGKPFPPLDVTRPWDLAVRDAKRLFARVAEDVRGVHRPTPTTTSGGCLTTSESGQRDNTMVIVVSDNGASGEGGPNGSVNEMLFANGIPDNIQSNLAKLDELGGTRTYNHYPNGWAMAFNTPFKMWKRYEFNGGTADPCIISWPSAAAGATGRGELRHQYHHAIDIVPTILDTLAVEAPETIKGHVQSPFDGVSMRSSIGDAKAPTTRRTQFYSMLGSRAIWNDGWKAVTTHPTLSGWSDFNDDTWELYHTMSTGPSCTTWPPTTRRRCASWSTCGSQKPEKTRPSRSMTGLRWRSLPHRPAAAGLPRDRYTYFPDTTKGARGAVVNIATVLHDQGRWSIFPPRRGRGLFAHGSRFGGHALYVKHKPTAHVNNFVGIMEQKIDATEDLPTGQNLILSASFDKDGEDPPHVSTGILSLYHGDQKVGEGRIKTRKPGMFMLIGENLCIGRDSGEPVTDDYPNGAPHRFTGGTIKRVAVDVGGDPYVDLEREPQAMLAASNRVAPDEPSSRDSRPGPYRAGAPLASRFGQGWVSLSHRSTAPRWQHLSDRAVRWPAGYHPLRGCQGPGLSRILSCRDMNVRSSDLLPGAAIAPGLCQFTRAIGERSGTVPCGHQRITRHGPAEQGRA